MTRVRARRTGPVAVPLPAFLREGGTADWPDIFAGLAILSVRSMAESV